jgi:hypothetical protein
MGFYEWRLRISLAAAQQNTDRNRLVSRSHRPRLLADWVSVRRWFADLPNAVSVMPSFGALRLRLATRSPVRRLRANPAAKRDPFTY